MKNVKRIGNNLLPVIAYGDCAGLPFEAKNRQYMAGYINSNGPINGLTDTTTNPYIGQYPAGTWSDDTHLSIAVARSIINKSGINLRDLADEHIHALNHTNGSHEIADLITPIKTGLGQNGWGKGTTNAVERLLNGLDPTESGIDTAGNGVLMKMAPLVYWQVVRGIDDSLSENQLIALTKMTHNNSEAIVASLTHKKILEHLLLQGEPSQFDRNSFLGLAHNYAKKYEVQLGAKQILSNTLQLLNKCIDSKEFGPDLIVSLAPKRGFYAPETLLMSYGSFILERNFPEATFRAVEMGGDTDSIGSIVATMSLFLNEQTAMPPDYEKVFDRQRLDRISALLAKTALQS